MSGTTTGGGPPDVIVLHDPATGKDCEIGKSDLRRLISGLPPGALKDVLTKYADDIGAN